MTPDKKISIAREMYWLVKKVAGIEELDKDRSVALVKSIKVCCDVHVGKAKELVDAVVAEYIHNKTMEQSGLVFSADNMEHFILATYDSDNDTFVCNTIDNIPWSDSIDTTLLI